MMQEAIEHDDLDGKWYFWEETWATRHGPFETREEAETALTRYWEIEDER